MTHTVPRRQVLQWVGAGVGILVSQQVKAQTKFPVRIGYQRFTELDLARVRGLLDQRLAKLGANAEWILFPSGPPMLEALNAGSLDFGGVGEAPPIFAQAAGTKFYYVGSTPRGPLTQDIVVLNDSPLRSIADLKGKKIALQRGSSAHYLLVVSLKENKIPYSSVEVVNLSPSDARVAFDQKNVDAWSIWDPFLAIVQGTNTTRSLNVGRDRRAFFLASQDFTNRYPALIRLVLSELKENENWGRQNSQPLANLFAKDLKIDPKILEIANDRRNWGLLPIDQATLAAQQQVADIFYDLKIIPRSIQVQDVALPPQRYAAIFPTS